MTEKRALPRVAAEHTSLGLPTIMDRELAAAHGVAYVHLAVFAIDIDRAYWFDPEPAGLPFGWEVYLTEWFLLSHLDPSSPAQLELLEAMCTFILEETPGEPPLGGQVVFAVYDAVARGALPAELSKLFSSWRTPPRELLTSLSDLHASQPPAAAALARYCLQLPLSPPLAPPTQAALTQIASGELEPLAQPKGRTPA